MKIKCLLLISIFSLIFGQLSAIADMQPQKIAVVDVQKVVSASKQVKALKKEQQARQKELQKFVKKADADVKKQSTPEAKKQAAIKYKKELADKKSFYANDYAVKVRQLDHDINAKIQQKAVEMGYNMALSKKSVVYGGDDITADVIKVIK